MKMPAVIGATFALFLAPVAGLSAYADDGGNGPHIHEESHGLEGLPIILIICALIIAVGLAYGIGRRSRK
jgi:hypothetical protein